MREIPFTQTNLLRCFRYQDLQENPVFKDREKRSEVALEAAKRISRRTVFSTPLRLITAKKKPAFSFGDIYQALTCRLIAKNIQRNYNLAPSNRTEVIRNLICYLGESYPIRLERLDIQSFFEEIKRDDIIPKILNDGQCSHHTAILLHDFFILLKTHGVNGLPRGLSISSTLAELVLQEFDQQMRSHSEVFLYARFVDDIIIGTSDNVKIPEILKEQFAHLPPPLKVHAKGEKRRTLIAKKTNVKETPDFFEYLGYRFTVHHTLHARENALGNLRRELKISIAGPKITKMKQRIILCFASYLASSKSLSDMDLLVDRIKFLCGNYHISDPFTGVKIKSGIFYNYPEKNHFIHCELRELDALLRGILYSNKHRLSRRVQKTISHADRDRLKGFSFVDGFHNKRFYSLSHTRLSEIKECWPQ
jgi:hypothetical protein